MTTYIALLRKDATSDFGVDFPDFPGCIAVGTTLEAARRSAGEALAFHIEGMHEDGEAIPEPSSLDTIMADCDNRDAVAILIDVAPTAAKSVRINVMLPEDLVRAIDRTTKNRSRFLADAARRRLRDVA